MQTIFSMRNDIKARLLDEYSQQHGVRVRGSYFERDALFFLFFIIEVLKFKKPNAVIFRYLNDHANILRTAFLSVNVIFTVLLCRLLSVQVLWILHNVDKETHEHYPCINKILRQLVGVSSEKIFVTDPLLIPVAVEKYPAWRNKVDYITFGIRTDKVDSTTDERLIGALQGLTKYREAGGFVLFCPTAGGEKYTHLSKAPQLMMNAREQGLKYKLVIVGELRMFLAENEALSKALASDEDIILLDRYAKYDAKEISCYIDFYWRSLSDQSVSFTLYEAASVEKPVLTLDEGFMGGAVKSYKMGAVLEDDFDNLIQSHSQLVDWDSKNAHDFLKNHSWEMAAEQITRSLKINAE